MQVWRSAITPESGWLRYSTKDLGFVVLHGNLGPAVPSDVLAAGAGTAAMLAETGQHLALPVIICCVRRSLIIGARLALVFGATLKPFDHRGR